MTTSTKNILKTVAKVSLTVLIFYWLISRDLLDFNFIYKFSEHPLLFLATLSLATGAQLMAIQRWRILLKIQNILSHFWYALNLSLIGQFFNFAMPGGVGGDLIKSYYLIQDHPEARGKAVLTVLADRVIGLHMMFFVAFFAILSDFSFIQNNPKMISIFYIITLACIFSSLGLFLVFSQNAKVKNFIRTQFFKVIFLKSKYHHVESLNSFAQNKGLLLKAYFYSFAAQSLSILVMYYVCQGVLQLDISIHSFFIIAPIGFIFTALPISPAGIGVGQAAFLFLFEIYDPKNKIAGPTGLTAYQFFLVIFAAIGGVIYLLRKKKKVEIANEK